MKSQKGKLLTKCVADLSLTHVPANNTKRVVLDLNIHFAHCVLQRCSMHLLYVVMCYVTVT